MKSVPNILLVDDEERFINSLDSILKHYDYSCTMALTGTDALKLLQEHDFDLALLDVSLPDISGCEIAEYIQKSVKNTTAVMLTGLGTVETAVKAMQNGAYDFLSKPINHELLIKTIDKALEHNQLTRKLEISHNRFQALAEASWEGIIIHDNGRFIEANRQFVKLFGYSAEELSEGFFYDKVVAPESLPEVLNRIKRKKLGSFEIIGRKKDGSKIPVEVKSQFIQYLERQVLVCAMRDISERVRAEEEKLVLQLKLAKAQKLRALGLMAGSVAHDLNNILTGVVSYPDLLLSQMEETDKYYPSIKKIQEAGQRASAVVSDLVSIARGRLPKTTVENINDIILSHLSSLEHSERQADYPGVVIQTQLQKNLFNSYCSPQHIHKILLNLIGNSLDALQDSGVIKISTKNCVLPKPVAAGSETVLPAGEYIKLTVADNGPGVKEKDKDHIFDPFYTTKKMGKSGTGLGLSIVWNTVQEHNGWVEMKDNNPGVRFEIYLPGTRDNVYSQPDIASSRSLKGDGESILLIDDEQEQNEMMTKLLTNLGYKVFSVVSGEAGLAFLQTRKVDLVVLDMIMGNGFNGRETYQRILKRHPHQKAIVISGYSRNDEAEKIKKLGVAQFLEKPVTLPQVGRAVKDALSKP
jgi:two-component system cell cycle sensor histidine kinase/response regulator CckA